MPSEIPGPIVSRRANKLTLSRAHFKVRPFKLGHAPPRSDTGIELSLSLIEHGPASRGRGRARWQFRAAHWAQGGPARPLAGLGPAACPGQAKCLPDHDAVFDKGARRPGPPAGGGLGDSARRRFSALEI